MFPNVTFFVHFDSYSAKREVNSTIFIPIKEDINSFQTIPKSLKEMKF